MARCHSWLLGVSVLVFAGTASAQGVLLSEDPLVDRCFQVEISMNLKGTLSFQQKGKTIALPQSASARHEYVERVLAANGGFAGQAFRIYKKGTASITVNKDSFQRQFRPDRTEAVAQHIKDRPFTYGRWGLFTREEVELTEHLDSLAIPGLLPNKEVKVGESWKVSNPVAQALCHLEGLTSQSLTCKLEAVEGSTARVRVQGEVQGIDLGASVQAKIQGSYQFHTQDKCITQLTWNNTETRGQAPVNPALEAVVEIQVKRASIPEPTELNKTGLQDISLGKEPSEQKVRITFTDQEKRFQLEHGRDWFMVGETSKHIVLRLMESGDFVAQATLAPLPFGPSGQAMSFEAFEKTVQGTPGWEPDTVIAKDAKIELPRNYKGYRLASSGKLEGVEAVLYFYLVVGPDGEQLLATFAMTPNQVQKLASRDLEFIQRIQFLDSKK